MKENLMNESLYLTYDNYSGRVSLLILPVDEKDLPYYVSKLIHKIGDAELYLADELNTSVSFFYIYINDISGNMRIRSNATFDFMVSILGKLII